LKPIEPQALARAIGKLERILVGGEARGDIERLLEQLRAVVARKDPDYVARIASRLGDRIDFVDVTDVAYFYAKDKLTFAATLLKHHVVDLTIGELETRLDPKSWIRIHRATLVNVHSIKEVRSSFGGRVFIRLKDGKTELSVPRERAPHVKAQLGI
jgi:DNA-binding LytR/AlgR family response regulator